MTASINPDAMNDFPPLPKLQALHAVLHTAYADKQISSATRFQIQAFLDHVQQVGTWLFYSDERAEAQHLLEIWTNVLINAGYEESGRLLDPFDPAKGPVLPDSQCPYPGLRAFDETDSLNFFSQPKLLDDLKAYLQQPQNRLLVLIGPSASGKTSLLFGGLLPQLKQEQRPGAARWSVCLKLVPGSHPVANLSQLIRRLDRQPNALASASSGEQLAPMEQYLRQDKRYLVQAIDNRFKQPVMVVVDRFEELFTLCDDSASRQIFVDHLLSLIEPPRNHTLIISMRSNFDARNPFAAELKALVAQVQPLFERSEMQIAPITAIQLREAIIKPAKRVGLVVYDELVDVLIQDVLNEQIPLPLLQFTLVKLWDQRKRNVLTLDMYNNVTSAPSDMSIIRQPALIRSADTVYNSFSDEQRLIVQDLLLSMIEIDDEKMAAISVRVLRNQLYPAASHRYDPPDQQLLIDLISQPANNGTPGKNQRTTIRQVSIDSVLERLADAGIIRLIPGAVLADDQVEIAHEVLTRSWGVLVAWLDSKRTSIVWRRRLRADAEYWAQHPAAIWPESRFQESLPLDYALLSELERRFLYHSMQEHVRRKEEEARQRTDEINEAHALATAQQQRADQRDQAAKRFRWIAISLAIAAGVAVIAAVFALVARQDAIAAQQNINPLLQTQVIIERVRANGAQAQANSAATDYAIARATANAAQDQVIENKATADTALQTGLANAQATASAEAANAQATVNALQARVVQLETETSDLRTMIAAIMPVPPPGLGNGSDSLIVPATPVPPTNTDTGGSGSSTTSGTTR
jgi:hypothetical protein